MKKICFLTFSVFLCSFFSSCNNKPGTKPHNEGINIIPIPKSLIVQNDAPFLLNKNTCFNTNSQEAEKIAAFFAAKMHLSTGYNIPINNTRQTNCIHLQLNRDADLEIEAYELYITAKKVNIEAKTPQGLFYGMQSLMQLFPAEIESKSVVNNIAWAAPALQIKDEPRLAHRGILIDVCRHFLPVEFIKKQIDVLSLFKINRLHWHLTDDQGWRIEIKKYPKLTEIGAKRIEGEGYEYGGFYTQEEIKEVVAYAAERFITVIPELEIPGHEMAAIAAYPELSCAGEQWTPRIIWGVEDIVMCPGKETMFTFLEDVIEEMVPLFPSEYFHIGGDECPKTSWKNCPNCQKRIREAQLVDDKEYTAEEHLQSYVINRIANVLAKHGKKIIGWDEILEGGLSPTATVLSWRGETGGIAASIMGHDVIMAPAGMGMYIDHYQGDSKIEPVAIGGYSPLSKVYAYNPVPDTLVKIGKDHHIIGVQCNIWAEYLYSPDINEYRIYPRILALSEIGWTTPENKSYDGFIRRINNACVRLDQYKINYHIPLPEQPNGSCNLVAFTDSAVLEFKTTRPIKMTYTLDGSNPTVHSTTYVQPVVMHKSGVLKICSVLPSGKTSRVRTIQVEKQDFAPATEITEPKPGLLMRTTDGMYLNTSELTAQERQWKTAPIQNLSQLRSFRKSDESMRNVAHYAAIATGYVNIEEDGVYYFSSNNDEVWIDDQLLIDNKNEVKKYSRNDASVALAKGLHKIKVVFLSHIIGGYPSMWDSGNVYTRQSDETNFKMITADMLVH